MQSTLKRSAKTLHAKNQCQVQPHLQLAKVRKIYGPRGNTTVVVNNAGSVITQENLVTSIVNGIERTTRRSFGTVGAFDRL